MNLIRGTITIVTPILIESETIYGRTLRGAIGEIAYYNNMSVSKVFPDWDTEKLIFRDCRVRKNIATSIIHTNKSQYNAICDGEYSFEILVESDYIQEILEIITQPVHIGKRSRSGYGEIKFDLISTSQAQITTTGKPVNLVTPAVTNTKYDRVISIMKKINNEPEFISLKVMDPGVKIELSKPGYGFGRYISLGFGEIS